jgi:hypothetical protein
MLYIGLLIQCPLLQRVVGGLALNIESRLNSHFFATSPPRIMIIRVDPKHHDVAMVATYCNSRLHEDL